MAIFRRVMWFDGGVSDLIPLLHTPLLVPPPNPFVEHGGLLCPHRTPSPASGRPTAPPSRENQADPGGRFDNQANFRYVFFLHPSHTCTVDRFPPFIFQIIEIRESCFFRWSSGHFFMYAGVFFTLPSEVVRNFFLTEVVGSKFLGGVKTLGSMISFKIQNRIFFWEGERPNLPAPPPTHTPTHPPSPPTPRSACLHARRPCRPGRWLRPHPVWRSTLY